MFIIFRKILDFLFPFNCLGCGKIDQTICDECLGKIEFLKNPELNCGMLDGVWAICRYEKHGPVATALHNWKYNGQSEFSQPLFKLLNQFWSQLDQVQEWQDELKTGKMAVVPIPMHPDKLKKREFNQAEEMAKAIFSTEIRKPLRKIKFNPAQMTLGAKDRKENVRGIFEFTGGEKPDTVLLIDDVATTMSTLEEAARVLKAAGVRKVFGLVLARQSLDEDSLAKTRHIG